MSDDPHSSGFPLYTAEAVRALDHSAIHDHGIEGYELMQRAGAASFQHLRERWPAAVKLLILAGGGNNGGDGYVIARLALEQGLEASVLALSPVQGLAGDAATAATDYRKAGGTLINEMPPAADVDVVVDALLGTGLDREVGGRYAEVIEALNELSKPVLAVDIPSGIAADTGAVMGRAVRADVTVSFIGRKMGLYTGAAPDYTGELAFESLKVPDAVMESRQADAWLMRDALRLGLLLRRSRTEHKGRHGHVLIVGGNLGMAGAARLAGESALRTGAGLVSVATRPQHVAALVAGRPELMVHGIGGAGEIDPLLKRADVVAVGPGLGRCEWAKGLLERVLAANKPTVVDADALNLMADQSHQGHDLILTPHPGEAARLASASISEIMKDRFRHAAAIAAQYQAVTVLKGAGTLVAATGQTPWVCGAGNPGMGSAGMGDVLTGIIAALRGQGLSAWDAARLGVWMHARAGDLAAQAGERGLVAGDLMEPLRSLANPGI